jgi:cytochrome c553
MLKNIIQKFKFLGLVAILGLTPYLYASEPAPKASKPDLAAGESLYSNGDSKRGVTACVGCHGANGNSGAGTWPKLAAQNATYLQTQLTHYKSGERANPVMMGMSMLLTEADMKNVSAYLEKQALKPGTAKNKDTIALGKSIYRGGIASKNVPACASCHGPSGSGIPVQYPRIGGQWAEYTQTQLVSFRAGERKNAQMNTISSKLNDKEMQAVSDYIAGLN